MQSTLIIDIANAFQFELLDARGRLVQNGNGLGKTTLNTQALSAGVYSLRISVNGQQGVYKVIKE